MGCSNSFDLEQNPLTKKSEKQILTAIKNSNTETLTYYLSKYLDIKVMEKYFYILKDFQDELKQIKQNNMNNLIDRVEIKQKIKTIEGNTSNHVSHILSNIKLADQLMNKLQEQLKRTKKLFNEKQNKWFLTAKQIIQKTRIITQITQIGQKMEGKAMERMKTMEMDKESQCIKKIEQKIEQTLMEQDIEINEKKSVVLTQVNSLNKIIEDYKKQLYKSKISLKQNQQLAQRKINSLQKQLQYAKIKINQLSRQRQRKRQRQRQRQKQTKTKTNLNLNSYQNNPKIQKNQQNILQPEVDEPSGKELQESNIKQMKQMTNSNQNIEKLYNEFRTNFLKFPTSSILNNINRGFDGSNRYKQIIDEIFNPIKINSSNSLFLFDKVTAKDMNHYINNQKDLLFLAQLQNGSILGAFSQLGFKKSKQNLIHNICFIFCIHSSQKYNKLQLKHQSLVKYSIKLDKNQLIFGQNEISIACMKNEGLSQMGTIKSIFGNNDKKMSVHQFLNMQDDKFQILNYEIHQLSLQYPEDMLKKCNDVSLQSAIHEE